MSSEFEEQGPLDPLEAVLAGFTPAPPQVDRDRLMFLAGQATCSPLAPQADTLVRNESTTRRRWLWPASTAALAATSLALAIALVTRPTPQPQIVYRDRPVLVEPTPNQSPAATVGHRIAQQIPPASRVVESPPIQSGYLKTRRVALRIGIDGLGSPASGSDVASPATYFDLLKALAGAPAAGPAEPASSPTM